MSMRSSRQPGHGVGARDLIVSDGLIPRTRDVAAHTAEDLVGQGTVETAALLGDAFGASTSTFGVFERCEQGLERCPIVRGSPMMTATPRTGFDRSGGG